MYGYQGGKARYKKEISKVIKDYEFNTTGSNTLDIFSPFCGLMSVENELMKDSNRKSILCNDLNPDIIAMWQSLHDNTFTPKKHITEEFYNSVKLQQQPSAERGHYLIAFSFSGIYNSGFRPKYQSKEQYKKQNESQYNKVLEMKKYLRENQNKYEFKCDTYLNYKPKNKLIYCDSPYIHSNKQGQNKYLKNFDYQTYWQTMVEWSKDNLVFISEQTIPDNFKDKFKVIWEKKRKTKIHTSKTNKSTEKLFIIKK